jgi:hypothetical protein
MSIVAKVIDLDAAICRQCCGIAVLVKVLIRIPPGARASSEASILLLLLS